MSGVWLPPTEPGPLRHVRYWLWQLEASSTDPEERSSIKAAEREVAKAEPIVRLATSASGKRFDKGVDIILNSGAAYDFAQAFFDFCDGKITEDEFRSKVGA